MNNLRSFSDKSAIGLSLLCAIHCLLLPSALVLLPSLAVLPFEDEAFHLGMLVLVLPTSIYALSMGCKKHKDYRLWAIGGSGLLLLILAALLGHDLLGESGEKALTVLGASAIAIGHIWNFRLCRKEEDCACAEGNRAGQ